MNENIKSERYRVEEEIREGKITDLQFDLMNLIFGYMIDKEFMESLLEKAGVSSVFELSDDEACEIIQDVKNYNATVGKEGFEKVIFD